MNDVDAVLESLRPRFRAARRRFAAKALGVVALPVALIIGLLTFTGGGGNPALLHTEAPPAAPGPAVPETTADPGAVPTTAPSTVGPPPSSESPASTRPAASLPVPTAAPPAPVATAPPPAPTAPTTTAQRREPYAGAPRCATHDPRAWHPLWDAARGCYYDHEHKDDPHELDRVFGKDFYTLAGGELGLPWTAPGDRADGRGNGWLVRADQGCTNPFGTGCVTDVRVQYHAVFSGPGAIERYRAAYVEARGCLIAQPSRCGIARVGGWVDFGSLWFDDVHVPLPGQPSERGATSRNHFTNGFATWFGRNPLFDLALTTSRSWGPVDRADPSALRLACPAVDHACTRDASRVGLHILAFAVPASLDGDGDGLVTWSGWYDARGNPAPGCTRAGADCVPVSFANMPVGTYQYRDDGHGYGDGGRADYDIAPPGASWLAYPN